MSPLLFKRLSDESLGSRLASGEAAAFDELYRRYVHRLAAYGSHLVGDGAAGDDVAQATLLKAYGVLRDGRVPDKMRPWLFRIAHNAAIDLVVRRRELPSDDLPERAARETEPMAGALVTALAALPDRQRRVYVLREVHGMRIDETAAELGLTSAQVEQSLFAARNRLAELLVFGDRLNCVTVQRLAAGPLDGDERRALKTHLRSCTDCRRAVGVRGRALSWLPAPTLDWLRGLLVGGAAPAAAKVGAVVATATIAASVPAVVEQTSHHHAHRPAVRHTRATVVHDATALVSSPRRRAVVIPVATKTAVVPAHVESRAAEPERQDRASESAVDDHATTAREPADRSSGGDSASREVSGERTASSGSADESRDTSDHGDGRTTTTTSSGDGGSQPPAVTTVPAVVAVPPMTTTVETPPTTTTTTTTTSSSGD